MPPGVNTQTPKAAKKESKKQNGSSNATNTNEKKEAGAGGAFADPYAGRRWIPRWISVPAQLLTLGIILYNRKVAIEERVNEVREEEMENNPSSLDGFDYPEDGIADNVAKAMMKSSSSAYEHKRTANTRADEGQFTKTWRHVNDNEVWDEATFDQSLYSTRCNIPKIKASDVSRSEFEAVYLDKLPVIIVGSTNTGKFAAAMQKAALLNRYGNHSVTLSSANKNSYDKQEAQLLYYVDEMMAKPQTLTAKGNETWYHFGDNKHSEWAAVFDLYEQPKKYIYGPYASLSFGLGSSGSGVPFHTHGHVFAEVFYGMKRWWLSPPQYEPLFGPDETSVSWLDEVYPFMMTHPESDASDAERAAFDALTRKHTEAASTAGNSGKVYTSDNGKKHSLLSDSRRFAPNPPQFYECTVGKGEMLYIPGFWWHSTLNIGETVFMSVFV